MCGIGGLFLHSPLHSSTIEDRDPAAAEHAALDTMLAIQHHRGPDACGKWAAVDGGITGNFLGLIHNRLAILDLSERGAQPMHSSDGRYTITFNGEIYNWLTLRRELEASGVTFKSGTDTEVILELYRVHGRELLGKLRGMFAFAIYDRDQQTLLCARDRVGKKPLIYSEFKNGFAFASEIPALLAVPGVETMLDHSAIASMLLHNLRHIPDPHTAFCQIRRLRPGHALLVENGRVQRIWQYWNLSKRSVFSADQSRTLLRDKLESSVALRMVADVPVGALLSGGIDSSAIVALMSKFSSEPINTYALGIDANDPDLVRARHMADVLGCCHQEFYFRPHQHWSDLHQMLHTYGEPIMLLPLLHTLELCRAIYADGMKVVLCGHGADEIFYGYTGHLRTSLLSNFLHRLSPLRLPVHLLLKLLGRSTAAALFAKTGTRKADLYRTYEDTAWQYAVNPDAKHTLHNLAAEEFEYWGSGCELHKYIDESNFLGLMVENTHSLMTASDLPAMMASVEMRAPFLDHELVELGYSISSRYKVRKARDPLTLKWILREAVRDLIPNALMKAPKRGFGFAIDEAALLRSEWRTHATELFSHAASAEGLFDPSDIKIMWDQFLAGGPVAANLVMRHLAIQVWLQEVLSKLQGAIPSRSETTPVPYAANHSAQRS